MWYRPTLLSLVIVLAAATSAGAEQIAVVVDASTAMWGGLGSGPAKIVALRATLDDLLVVPALASRQIELGLRFAGGTFELIDERGCSDSRVAIPIAPLDVDDWRQALAGLYPLGQRPLASALRQAAADLHTRDGPRRLVVVTAGNDTCGQNFGAAIQELFELDEEIEIRLVGLGLDRETANAATRAVPTRNVAQRGDLEAALRWALGVEDDELRASPVELRFERGGHAIGDGELVLVRASAADAVTVSLSAGVGHARVVPGRYSATISEHGQRAIELFAIDLTGDGGPPPIGIPQVPPVTLELDPPQPLAHDNVYVQYWGAPEGRHRIAIATADADESLWLTHAEIAGGDGEAELRLPGIAGNLEARFVQNLGDAAVMVRGRAPFTSRRPTASLDVVDAVENGQPLVVRWSGPNLSGDHITLTAGDSDQQVACVPASPRGAVELTAPPVAGEYVLRYVTSTGHALVAAGIDVFEILATLDFEPRSAPRAGITVNWSGPAHDHDFVSLAIPESDPLEYLDFAPVAAGDPSLLDAPASDGIYEIRYVRASDGQVLAREALHVVAEEIALSVPSEVVAGTRFDVHVSGTVGPGVYVAVAEIDAGIGEFLDWAHADDGDRLTLAAPFEPGEYEVRLISRGPPEIKARARFTAR